VAVAASLAAACAAALRHASSEDAVRLAPQWPGTTVEDLERGRRLYVRRCAGCHTLVLPAAHPPEEWPRLLDSMSKKARLRLEEREDIQRFLVAVASNGAEKTGR
jgi:mono/diheme cytochrome c family protein